MTDVDTLAATVREQLAHLGPFRGAAGDDALAALVEHARTLERERDEALQANEGKANLILHDALIARIARFENHLKEIRAAARFKHYRSIELMADTALAGEDAAQDRRFPACVKRWPECEPGAYHPDCCRFPKSCSCVAGEDA